MMLPLIFYAQAVCGLSPLRPALLIAFVGLFGVLAAPLLVTCRPWAAA